MSVYGTLLSAVKTRLDETISLADFTIVKRRKPRLISTDDGPMIVVSPLVEAQVEYSFGAKLQVAYPVQVTIFIDSQRFLFQDAEVLLAAREAIRSACFYLSNSGIAGTDGDPFPIDATDIEWDPNPPFDGAGLAANYDASSQVFTYTLEHDV